MIIKSVYLLLLFIDDNNFRIFKAHLCSVHEDGFRQVHNRFQTLLLWYIDGANFIDLEDVHWEIIYLCVTVPVHCSLFTH